MTIAIMAKPITGTARAANASGKSSQNSTMVAMMGDA